MKLTEQQLAQLFQQSTQADNENMNLSDCLATPSVSHAETIVSDFNSAQAVKLAIHMQPWSEQVAHDLNKSQTVTWSQRLHNIFHSRGSKSPVFMASLAVVFTLTAVVFLSNHQTNTSSTQTNMVNHDVINSMPFEGDNDRLSKGSFDGQEDNDQLFRANFS